MRKNIKFILTLLVTVIFTLACADNDINMGSNLMEETEDLESLRKVNEQLVGQLENVQLDNEKLTERVERLLDENMQLKDDILTYKQQVFEQEDFMVEERQLRNELDEKSMHVFEAMNEKDHERLQAELASNITILREEEQVEIDSEYGLLHFPYLSLHTVHYLRQSNYTYDHENGLFTLEYTLYTGGVKEPFKEEIVYLSYLQEEDWKLTRISHLP